MQQVNRVETERMGMPEMAAAGTHPSDSFAGIAHDARNMVTALGLYCDLLEEPGVLTPGFQQYGVELRQVAAASRNLVERLVALDSDAHWNHPPEVEPESSAADRPRKILRWKLVPTTPIDDLAAEALANRPLLSAVAGPEIRLSIDVRAAARPVKLTGEDLTRVLVNLVKNAAEASPAGGSIRIAVRALETLAGTGEWLLIVVEDSGPGVPATELEKIFEPGYTTRKESEPKLEHRGLGLSIARSLVESAGGRIGAANSSTGGARMEIALPVRTRSDEPTPSPTATPL